MVYEHGDPTNHGFWNPPCLGPWNQNVGSLCLCGLWGPDSRCSVLIPASCNQRPPPSGGRNFRKVTEAPSPARRGREEQNSCRAQIPFVNMRGHRKRWPVVRTYRPLTLAKTTATVMEQACRKPFNRLCVLKICPQANCLP